jgi:hypothetical protein
MTFELKRGRRAAGEEHGEARAEYDVRAETWPEVRAERRSREARAEMIPQAWQFEVSGKAARRELSGSTVRRGLNMTFEPKRGRRAAGEEHGEARAE